MIRLFFTLLTGERSHAAQHAAGRALLYAVLGDVQLAYAPGGKPFIPGGPDFSISHSDALVLLAVSEAGPIGCDAERTDRVVRNPEALRRKLAPTPEEEELPLIQLWVRREAMFKAGGAGEVVYPHVVQGYTVAVCTAEPNAAIQVRQVTLLD